MRQRLFISYSHKDVRWFDRVREHLAVLEQEGILDAFDDTRIGPGEDWYARLHEEMLNARIAVLLVSAAFLTSPFIREKEIPRLFGKHETGGMLLYPLLVRDCAWQEVSWLARLQLRPKDARPLAGRRGAALDKCLADVAREIASIVRDAATKAEPPAKNTSVSTADRGKREWSAKLVERGTRVRVVEVNLTHGRHLITFEAPFIDVLNPFVVKVDEEIVYYDTRSGPGDHKFKIADGTAKRKARVESGLKGINAIAKFRLTIEGKVLYSDGY